MKKLTKREMFEQLKANYPLTSEEVAFIDHELELLARKNSSDKKPSANQIANQGLKDAILSGMEVGKQYTITDLIKEITELNELTNQKVSALVKQLVDTEQVVKTVESRKSYFSIAE